MTAVLVIMARQPLAGEAKTRLIPEYGEHGAAAIAEFLLTETVHIARQYWPGEILLSMTPDCHHPAVRVLCERHKLACHMQCEGDLGRRMQHEIHQVVSKGGYGVVIGTDAPHALAPALPLVWQAAQAGKTVIAASNDGGYYLLGMMQMNDSLFISMPWGSDKVYRLACEAIGGEKADFIELPPAIDIDTAEDLQQVAGQYKPLQDCIQSISG